MSISISDNKWSAITFFALLLFMSLFYQVAWQYPVVDGYPLIERLLDPTFLTNDFYTNTFGKFSPRLVHSKMIVAGSDLFGVHYTEFVAYANILRIALYGIALYLLFLYLSDRETALIAFAMSALSFLSMPFLPAWWPISYDLTSSNIASVFAMFAWVCVVRGKVSAALLLLTFTVLIHPLIGVHALLISVLLYIAVFKWRAFFSLFKLPSMYFTGALFGVTFLYIYLSFEQVLSDQRFIEINAEYRHAHHFVLSHMELEKWISTITFLLICIAITKWEKRNNIKDDVSLPIVTYSLVVMLLGYIFIEIFPTRFMVSFIPLRAFPILVPIVLLATARFAFWKWQNKDYTSFFLLFLPFLPYYHVGLTWYLLPNAHFLVLPLIVLVISFSTATISEQYPAVFYFPNKLVEGLFRQSPLGVYLLPIALVSLLLAVIKFNINIPTLQNSAEIYRWLNKNTTSSDIILSELDAADNQKLRLLAKRAIVVSKDFPFNEHFYEEWYQRYSSLYLSRDEARGHIDALNASELDRLMDNYDASILIRTAELNGNSYFTEIGRAQGEKADAIVYRNKELQEAM